MTTIIYDDFLCNFDLGFSNAIRCHENLDFALSPQCDLQYTKSAIQAVLQKVFLYMGIKEGEVPGDPELGCCIYRYFYKKAIATNFGLLARELSAQLKKFMPELQVKSVSCEGPVGEYGRIDSVQITIMSETYGQIDLTINKQDLEDLNDALQMISQQIVQLPTRPITVARPSVFNLETDFSQSANSQYENVIL